LTTKRQAPSKMEVLTPPSTGAWPMRYVTPQLPVVAQTEIRPSQCPHCSEKRFQRLGKVSKPVTGNQYRTCAGVSLPAAVTVGVHFGIIQRGRACRQTERLRKLWRYRLVIWGELRRSSQDVVFLSGEFMYMSVWRDLAEQASLGGEATPCGRECGCWA